MRQEQLMERLGEHFRELDTPLLVEWSNGRREAILFMFEAETKCSFYLNSDDPLNAIGHADYSLSGMHIQGNEVDGAVGGAGINASSMHVSPAGIRAGRVCRRAEEWFLPYKVNIGASDRVKRLPVAKELGETSLMFMVHPTLTEENMPSVFVLLQTKLEFFLVYVSTISIWRET